MLRKATRNDLRLNRLVHYKGNWYKVILLEDKTVTICMPGQQPYSLVPRSSEAFLQYSTWQVGYEDNHLLVTNEVVKTMTMPQSCWEIGQEVLATKLGEVGTVVGNSYGCGKLFVRVAFADKVIEFLDNDPALTPAATLAA